MGEFELLARVRERLPAAGAAGAGSAAATTRRSPCRAAPPRPRSTRSSRGSTSAASRRASAQIGRKALATALSDLAAMGAEPGEAYVVLGVPADLDEDGCLELLDGIAALAARDRHDAGRRRRDPRAGADRRDHRGRPRAGARAARHAGRGAARRRARRSPASSAAPRRACCCWSGRSLAVGRPATSETAKRLRAPPARAAAAAGGGPRARRGGRDGDDRPQRRARRRRPPPRRGERRRAADRRRRPARSPTGVAEVAAAAGRTRCSWPSPAARTTSCWRRSRRSGSTEAAPRSRPAGAAG